jgi:hypothetical protein
MCSLSLKNIVFIKNIREKKNSMMTFFSLINKLVFRKILYK